MRALISAALLVAACSGPARTLNPAECPTPPTEDTQMKSENRSDSKPAADKTTASSDAPLRLDAAARKRIVDALVAEHGAGQRARARRGLDQVVARWRPSDGDAGALERFVRRHFASDEAVLRDTLAHLEYALEMLDGHANEVARELSRYQVLAGGPIRPVDRLLAAYSPTAHINEDLFRGKIAFVALLNFPLTTLSQRLKQGRDWTRQQWARARLTGRFEHRVPAAVVQENDRISAAVEGYIDGYNVHMDRVVAPDGSKPFRAGLKLISHWGLRDEIRGLYARGAAGLQRQRLIARIMERIITQQIPADVIGSDDLEWDPSANKVRPPGGKWREAGREPDTRYAHLLRVFRGKRALDPHFPGAPTHIRRIFELEREVPERRMRELLVSVLSAPVARRVGKLVQKELGRPLEPFDLWYPGFRVKSALGEQALDRITRRRYPDARAFRADIPRLLRKLGFAPRLAAFIGERIEVEAARGAGHAYGAKRRDDRAHLRTRIGSKGMSYKGYNIAIHELGHNVEQVISMSRIDHTLLEGVPNTGFTEAFAFLFQARDLELLGKARPRARDAETRHILERFWATFEIAGVALLDMDIWRWMYRNPDATPEQLRRAVVRLTRKLWNTYYAPVFGVKDQILPAIYSHIIAYGLYTPDYPLGKLITFQIEQYLRGRRLGAEMDRMCKLGRIAPDVWMQQAVGSRLSSEPLLRATRAALK